MNFKIWEEASFLITTMYLNCLPMSWSTLNDFFRIKFMHFYYGIHVWSIKSHLNTRVLTHGLWISQFWWTSLVITLVDMRCPVEKKIGKDCINIDSFIKKKFRFLIHTTLHSLKCSFLCVFFLKKKLKIFNERQQPTEIDKAVNL